MFMQEKTLGMNINVLIVSMDLAKEPWYFSSMIESYTKKVWVWPMKVHT
jgi:type III secretory pathway component EscS